MNLKWYSVCQNRASKKCFFAIFHRLHFIHSPGTRGFMIMEEEVDGPLREKRSIMNYTKKSKPIGNNPLQHSTRSCLKFISCKEKRYLAGEVDVCMIACWSRIQSKHINALMSLMTQTQMMMINSGQHQQPCLQSHKSVCCISYVQLLWQCLLQCKERISVELQIRR